jgi:heme O synthase-like polyprenyltransferase
MLPVTHGEAFTRLQLLLYTLLLTAVDAAALRTAMAGFFYLGAALVLDAVFLGYADRHLARTTATRSPAHLRLSRSSTSRCSSRR